jgi:hypothetical protein
MQGKKKFHTQPKSKYQNYNKYIKIRVILKTDISTHKIRNHIEMIDMILKLHNIQIVINITN